MYKRKPKQRSKCAHCGELFTHAMPNARYCSGACRIAAFRARKLKAYADYLQESAGDYAGYMSTQPEHEETL